MYNIKELRAYLVKSNTIMTYTGEPGYDGPLYDGLLSVMDDMLGPSPMHIKYVSCAYDGAIFLVSLGPSYPSSPVLSTNTYLIILNQTKLLVEPS